MKFQFLHAADLHLDSPLEGLSRYEGVPVEQVRSATRDAFEKLIDDALRLEVKFIVIAGDVSDGKWNDINTGLYFARQCARAAMAGIKVFVLWGNHDAESDVTKRLRFAEGITTFGHKKAESFRIEELKVIIHGQSYGKREVLENLAAGYPSAEPGWFNIGVLHTSLTGGHEHHAPYAPCTPADLAARLYDYWALGHVHTHAVVSRDPWIVFPGNLQGRSVRETGLRGAMLVTVDDGKVIEAERLPYDVMRWREIVVDLSDVVSVEMLMERISQVCASASDEEGVLVAIRLRLRGRTSIHGRLFNEEKSIVEQVRGVAVSLGDGRCWIEKVKVETQPLRTPEELAARGDAMAELQQLLAGASSDPELQKDLQDAFTELRSKVLDEVLTGSEMGRQVKAGEWTGLVDAAGPTLIEALGEV